MKAFQYLLLVARCWQADGVHIQSVAITHLDKMMISTWVFMVISRLIGQYSLQINAMF